MNRKQFIQSQGGTCKNWTWSWSFVNEQERFVIFGLWDVHEDVNRSLIFSLDWKMRKGKRRAPWSQSRDHIRLIEEKGYRLKIFNIYKASATHSKKAQPPWKIASFTPELQERKLQRVGRDWFSYSDAPPNWLPEEVGIEHPLMEGTTSSILVNKYERNATARSECISHYGAQCIACGFNFESRYGELGKGYIHVHHIVPLAQIRAEYEVDPIKDLLPVCANCHAMIHSTRPILSIDQIKSLLQDADKA